MSEFRVQQGDIRPIPDPTLLTTAQLREGLLSLREFILSELRAVEKVHEERFRSIDTRFSDNRITLDVALGAQKEAAEKNERAFAEQIKNLATLMQTTSSATDDKINGLKDRLTSGEGVIKGATDNTARLMGAVLLVLTLGMAVYTVAWHQTVAIAPAVVTPHS